MTKDGAVRWGFLSTAKINDLVLAGTEPSDQVEVVAVASRDRARAEAYARERGIARAHGSYEALLEDPDVEAVYISLPNSLHVEWSIRALEAEKHVLCEKPLGRRADEVERAFDAAERAGRILMEAFMWRHNPQTVRLKELVAGGAIGELRVVRAVFSFPLADPANIRLAPDLDGGALMDVGCYCVSGARLLAGEPEYVSGFSYVDRGVDTFFAGTLSFPGEVFAEFDCGFRLPKRDELEAIGEDGSLFLDDPWHARSPGIELRTDDGVERISIEPADSYRLQLENMGAAIRGEAEPLLGRADALGQARAIEALYRAADERQAVGVANGGAESGGGGI
jgi:D-xylose 1-dehydrogenase (NADP+, D-xylono-1,5-lactone-forming)